MPKLIVACFRLSDSGEDEKVKGTRKGVGREKGKSFIFMFALSQFRGPEYLGTGYTQAYNFVPIQRSSP